MGILALLAFPMLAAGADLSMETAITRAIETNLQSKLAQASSREARGKVLQSAAALLPQLTGTISQTRIFKQNLATLGLNPSPIFPNLVIGPYDVFDARLSLVQKLLDLGSLMDTKEAAANDRVAEFQLDLAAEQVAAAAALAYVEDLRALRGVEDAQSNWQLAQKLLTLTQHQHEAGVATAVDLARAETRLAVDRQNLIQAQLSAYRSDIQLKRVIGAALQDLIELPAASTETSVTGPEEAAALDQAAAERLELRITHEQARAEGFGLAAAEAGFLPLVSVSGDYGFSGNTPDTTARTGSIGASLSWPLFSGGATRGLIVQARGRRFAAQSRYEDTRIQVEEDVRLALHTLSAEKDDVEAAATRQQLAERELTLAQNRYRAGLGDNIQVVTAQASLADALQAWVDARARYADARVNLAVALGRARAFRL